MERQEELAKIQREMEEFRTAVRARTVERDEVRTARNELRTAARTLEDECNEERMERDASWTKLDRSRHDVVRMTVDFRTVQSV